MNMLSAGTPPAEPILTCTVCELLNILEGETAREKERNIPVLTDSNKYKSYVDVCTSCNFSCLLAAAYFTYST